MHEKAIFDRTEVAAFLTYQDDSGRIQHKPIMADLGYMGIARTYLGAVLPHKCIGGWDLTAEHKAKNQVLSSNRIVVENFCAQWKSEFGVPTSNYRGNLRRLDIRCAGGRIRRTTPRMGMTGTSPARLVKSAVRFRYG
jgi:hypothetical protein